MRYSFTHMVKSLMSEIDLFLTHLPWTKWPQFADDIFKCIFVNEKSYILIEIPLKFVPECPIDNNPA